MLTIRKHQMVVFGASTRKSFEERMVVHMQARSLQANVLPMEALRNRTLALIDFAEKHGIDLEGDIRRFLELVFDRPNDFLGSPQALAILDNNRLSSSAKVAFLTDLLLPRGS